MIILQGEHQRPGGCAKYLSGGKVDAVIHLEVKAARQSAYQGTESKNKTEGLLPQLLSPGKKEDITLTTVHEQQLSTLDVTLGEVQDVP